MITNCARLVQCARILTVAAATLASVAAFAGSEVYIQQSRGNVAPGTTVMVKPPPETAAPAAAQQSADTPRAPETCNAQNASSQACYTATQQARPSR